MQPLRSEWLISLSIGEPGFTAQFGRDRIFLLTFIVRRGLLRLPGVNWMGLPIHGTDWGSVTGSISNLRTFQ